MLSCLLKRGSCVKRGLNEINELPGWRLRLSTYPTIMDNVKDGDREEASMSFDRKSGLKPSFCHNGFLSSYYQPWRQQPDWLDPQRVSRRLIALDRISTEQTIISFSSSVQPSSQHEKAFQNRFFGLIPRGCHSWRRFKDFRCLIRLGMYDGWIVQHCYFSGSDRLFRSVGTRAMSRDI